MHTHGYQEAPKNFLLDAHMETAPTSFKVFACRTREDVREYDYIASGGSSATSAVPCTATTRHMAAQALPRPRLAARLLIIRIALALLPMPCIRTCHLVARFLIGRSHWLSLCARSLCLAARLLVVRIAPALLRLCRASGRAIPPLDFSSVGRTWSRCAPGHRVSRLDYSSSGLHRLYCAYAVHPDVPSLLCLLKLVRERWRITLRRP
jgi:hypothetical protein